MKSTKYKKKLLIGNCLDTLKQLANDSIDSVVTDPPYELGFMGKSWDSTGIAFNVDVWQECLRVLKPGGHLIAFSGSRTYHRMAVAIEDAGFEIRDQIMWVYGSGFPKSMAIDKAIDKAKGATRKVVDTIPDRWSGKGNVYEYSGTDQKETANITIPATKEAKQWQGWGTALKPAHEPMVLARKPLSEKTVASNVLTYGTGAINIDASRVGFVSDADKKESTDKNQHADFGTKPITNNTVYGDYSMIEPKNYQPTGRFPANFILTHNHDCQETGTKEVKNNSHYPDMKVTGYGNFGGGKSDYVAEGLRPKSEVVSNWSCTPGCPATQFPNSKGNGATGGGEGGIWTKGNKQQVSPGFTDSGSAARFFYCAKASKSERNAGLDGLPILQGGGMSGTVDKSLKTGSGNERDGKQSNFHPTVKPVALMRYLIKLVTPPNGTVLDPFLGSGTTAVAATLDNFNWVGCEMTDDYLPIIKGRVDWATKENKKAKQQELDLYENN